jgi:hypothetical protein
MLLIGLRRNAIMREFTRMISAAAILMIGISGPAMADCYDILGCTDRDLFSKHFDDYLAAPHPEGPNCEFLWTMRNGILAERGYCFQTPRGRSRFSNEGCRYNDVNRVPLSSIERANIATIARAERVKGCR